MLDDHIVENISGAIDLLTRPLDDPTKLAKKDLKHAALMLRDASKRIPQTYPNCKQRLQGAYALTELAASLHSADEPQRTTLIDLAGESAITGRDQWLRHRADEETKATNRKAALADVLGVSVA